MTSLFSSSWMCRLCGREACGECFERVQALTLQRADAPAPAPTSFLRCTGKVDHAAKDFSPVSRFDRQELHRTIEEMEALLSGDAVDMELSPPSSPFPALTPSPRSTPAPRTNIGDVPTHPVSAFAVDELTEEAFRARWTQGEPLVVGGLEGRYRIGWTPAYFIANHGKQKCVIVDCQTGKSKTTTVGAFFERFGKYGGRKEVWKLKVGLGDGSRMMC